MLELKRNKLQNIPLCTKFRGSKIVIDRQKDSHPHSVYTWHNFVYICDLGADKIWIYQREKLHKMDHVAQTPSGWGPRHMAFLNRKAYVLFELKNQIGVYDIDETSGRLKNVQNVETAPQGLKKHCTRV